jgi:ribosomal protein S18 acetylase RimI-like enzyme
MLTAPIALQPCICSAGRDRRFAGLCATMIRPAELTDIPALVAIENRSFDTDRLSQRSFRYLLSRGHAATIVEVGKDGEIRGYAMVLFSRGTSLARLYSIAVDPDHRGQGRGTTLLRAAEVAARDNDAAYMRLEVRVDDTPTQRLYYNEGYRKFAVQHHYYDDDVDAIRMEKPLGPRLDPSLARVPYYSQSLEFTCGPAALLMAMHAIDPAIAVDETAELRLWRESTTIYMTSGHGGCSPLGLAVAAVHRGFRVEVWLSQKEPLFVNSVRSEKKKEVIRLVEEDFRMEAREQNIPINYRPLPVKAMRQKFEEGGIPVVLISSYRFDREKTPHWVVVTGFDDKFAYLHDPFIDPEQEKSAMDCMQIPVPLSDFERMARYGRSQQKAALVISPRRQEKG